MELQAIEQARLNQEQTATVTDEAFSLSADKHKKKSKKSTEAEVPDANSDVVKGTDESVLMDDLDFAVVESKKKKKDKEKKHSDVEAGAVEGEAHASSRKAAKESAHGEDKELSILAKRKKKDKKKAQVDMDAFENGADDELSRIMQESLKVDVKIYICM
jgi:hypothetical protein